MLLVRLMECVMVLNSSMTQGSVIRAKAPQMEDGEVVVQSGLWMTTGRTLQRMSDSIQ